MWARVVNAWNGSAGQNNAAKITSNTYKTYAFEDVSRLVSTANPPVRIIDVRTQPEFSTGHIPGAANIPLASYPNAFALDPEQFRATFGFAKPATSQELLFVCQAGGRAKKARDAAEKSGYTHASVYPGSTNDWVGNGGRTVQ